MDVCVCMGVCVTFTGLLSRHNAALPQPDQCPLPSEARLNKQDPREQNRWRGTMLMFLILPLFGQWLSSSTLHTGDCQLGHRKSQSKDSSAWLRIPLVLLPGPRVLLSFTPPTEVQMRGAVSGLLRHPSHPASPSAWHRPCLGPRGHSQRPM